MQRLTAVTVFGILSIAFHGTEAVGIMAGAIAGSVGGCVGLIYPVLLLIFMTRPKIAAAFLPSVEAA